ncbi:MAG: metal-dependent transcriptional regulator, partial [Planctomycetaceae bacterium]|nr:metal-dependent transcriptional regulator [Planctomycetaceae bacterium]
EAEHMEHAVSDFLVDHIDDFLGRPVSDPHGDPIPSADGTMRGGDAPVASLASIAAGTPIRIVRVTNQHADFLRYLSESGLELGAEGVVRENRPEAGIVTTEIAGRIVTLGHPAAGQILVELRG